MLNKQYLAISTIKVSWGEKKIEPIKLVIPDRKLLPKDTEKTE
jgi:hypothetical protein